MIEGFLFINKPTGITSFDCIRHIKRIITQPSPKATAGCPLTNQKNNKKVVERTKIGHAGTLDPFATGLLIIGVGRNATKYLSMVMKTDKQYIATGKLGVLTDSLDKTGTIIESTEIPKITKEQLIECIAALGTSYTQTPPAYSALKYKGTPLYKLARKGEKAEKLSKIIESKKRTVPLYCLELIDFDTPYFTIKADVSHGTYIRSLVNDIAQQCDTYATTWELSRTKIGPITLEQSVNLDEIKTIDDVKMHLISVDRAQSLFRTSD